MCGFDSPFGGRAAGAGPLGHGIEPLTKKKGQDFFFENLSDH